MLKLSLKFSFKDVRKAELYDKCIAVKQFKESECSIGNSLQEAEIMRLFAILIWISLLTDLY